jgi:hypothetical protein
MWKTLTWPHHFTGAHKTSITLSLFIEVPVPSQESESCICVLGDQFCPFLWFFYWILERFRQCCIFSFLFYAYFTSEEWCHRRRNITYQNRNNSRKPECVLSFNMGWRILVNFIHQSMLKLQAHSGFHDLFLKYDFI